MITYVAIAIDTLVVLAVVLYTSRLVTLQLSGTSARSEWADELIREHVAELRAATRWYRWFGVAVTAMLVITIGVTLWQFTTAGSSSIILALVVYDGVLIATVRYVFSRVDKYEAMVREFIAVPVAGQ